MNNITFTAHLNSNLVSDKVVKDFSRITQGMPSGTMFLYKDKNSEDCYIASLKPEGKGDYLDKLEIDKFDTKNSDEYTANILAYCYKLLLGNKQYKDMCAKLAQEQNMPYIA